MLVAFSSMYVYIFIYLYLYTHTQRVVENSVQPSTMRCCSGNANNYQLVGKNINFTTSPFPQSLHMHSGNWTLPRCVFAPGGGENTDQFFRVDEIDQGRFYCTVQRNVAASHFSPECRCCGDSDTSRGKQGAPRAGAHPSELPLPGAWPGGEHWEPGQSHPGTLVPGTSHTMCRDNDKQESQNHFAALQFLL